MEPRILYKDIYVLGDNQSRMQKNERLQYLILGSGWVHAASSRYNSAKKKLCLWLCA
jgi:hypothetical protein